MWSEYSATAVGSLDAVVLNAGINRVGLVENNSEADFDDVMGTSLIRHNRHHHKSCRTCVLSQISLQSS
jgi:NAD(P)-dependent dehydrogenase (short-subunit alcohol dehydrogenase family)